MRKVVLFVAIALVLFAGCKKDPVVPGPSDPNGNTEKPEPDDPTVLQVKDGDDLAAILSEVPEGIKSLFLAEGTFVGPFTMVEGINVKGSGPNTVLTVEQGRVLEQIADFSVATTWSNLTITGGRLSSANGAGVYLRKNGILSGCNIHHNRAEGGSSQGGGVWAAEGSIVTGCTLHDNFAQNAGGGLYSKGLVKYCTIENNEAPDNVGGGAQIHGGSKADNNNGTMYNCIIRGNSSKNAGGLRLYGNTQVANLLVEGNTATGGGVSGILSNGVASILNCTIVKNYDAADAGNSSALYINQNGTIKNCLLYGNYSKSKDAGTARQMYVNHQYTWLMNNAVTAGGLKLHDSYDPNGNGRNKDLQTIPAGSIGIFKDYAGGNYHLDETASMLIDKGNASLFGFMVLDVGGAPRRFGTAPDIGAYEFPTPVPEGGFPVVLIGDSIFDRWDSDGTGHPEFFSEHNIMNSGVSGQTTDQMLERFDGSVLYYKPRKVVLEGGTNDLTRVQTWDSSFSVIANISEMATRAGKAGAAVLISSILPCNASATGELTPQELIISTNEKLKALAQTEGYTYIDFYSSLANEDGTFKDGYHSDGVHPNAEGYTVMEGILLDCLGK
jgi:lysophospholipase L1-like esterase